MTFFQRIRTPFGEGPVDEQAQLQPRMRMIGDLLQERREELGLDLDEIGAMLRIKPGYLAALEQGRTHDLPGPAYAIGFVRAYADFLGLDSDAVLTRFKAEAAGVAAHPDLSLPVPLGERSLPGGTLVLVALILALCGYGIWYYLSTEERNRPERVAAVPASLAPPPASAAAAASPPTAPATSDSAQPPAQSPLYGAAAGSTSTPTSAAPSAPPPAAQTPVASPGTSPTGGPQGQPAAGGNLAPGALLTPIARNGPPTPAASAAPPQAVQQTAPSVSQIAPAPQAAPPLASQPAPQVASITAASPAPQGAATPGAPAASAPAVGAKVTIKALADCWIQVRGPDQSIVFSRVLKSGETYTVPQRSGLALRTGNAGALEIAVDGKTAPPIGGIGALRRDVVLDPGELAAGTAVHG